MGERAWDHGVRFAGDAHRCRSCASFNAPIAGALFALEVILRHFALHAFSPIVIAWPGVVHQIAFGDQVEFNLPLAPDLQFYVELPAFMGLGLVSGVVAVIVMRSIFLADTPHRVSRIT